MANKDTINTGTTVDVQARVYRDGYSVIVTANKLGQMPTFIVGNIDPTPALQLIRIGPYVAHVTFGAGPNGEPVVEIIQE